MEAKIGNTEADRSDRLGRPVRPVWTCAVRVELGFVLWNPFVTQFRRGMSSPAYKYKGHGRLRSFYPIESINLHFSYFSPNPNFSNLMLFVDVELVNTQALERADRNDQNSSNESLRPVRPVASTGQTDWTQQMLRDLKPQALDPVRAQRSRAVLDSAGHPRRP